MIPNKTPLLSAIYKTKRKNKYELQTKHRTNKIKNDAKRLLNNNTIINKQIFKINNSKRNKRK